MRYLPYIAIALASSMLSASATLWYAAPRTAESSHAVTRPPLKVEHQKGHLLISGSWETTKGYQAPGINAVEIRCDTAGSRCTEAYASTLHHTEGEDLEAQVFDYVVQNRTETEVLAVAAQAMGCLDRRLMVDLVAQQARLEWSPSAEAGCEGDIGAAVLSGDPL